MRKIAEWIVGGFLFILVIIMKIYNKYKDWSFDRSLKK